MLTILFLFAVSQGLDSIYSPDFKPILHNGVSYIVVTVLINDKNEVLMMQEAKSSCAGTWYLPAGRVEVGENLIVSVHALIPSVQRFYIFIYLFL